MNVLKISFKENIDFIRENQTDKDYLGQSMNCIDSQMLQKTVKDQIQILFILKRQIESLKAQLQINRSYTDSLQQKYTILLQSVQPFEEKVLLERLVQKIAFLQNHHHGKGLKTNSIPQLNNVSSQDDLQYGSREIHCQPKSSFSKQYESREINLQEKSSFSSLPSFKQLRIRKQSSDSSVQVCLPFNGCTPIKRQTLQYYISPLPMVQISEQVRPRKVSQTNQSQNQQWQKLIQEYLQNGEAMTIKFKHRSEQFLRKCVPHQLRSVVWNLVFQNTLAITNDLYMQLLQRRAKQWIQDAVKVQIQKDIVRSFTGKAKDTINKQKLILQVTQVLQLFHIYRPDISYIQGMTYPAIILTQIVGKIKAFTILSNRIVSIPFFKRLYTFEQNYPTIYCRTFDILLKETNFSTYQLLRKKNINSEIFLIQWFYTFFSRGLNHQTILKLWDHFAYYDQVVFFKMALTVLELVQNYITDSTFQDTITLIKEFSSYIDQKKIIQTFINNKITQERYKRAYRKALKSDHPN